MPKKTNAVNLSNNTPAQNKALMEKYKKTRGNNKTNKNHRNKIKNKKRMVNKWGNPTKENKKTNPNLDFVKKTGNEVLAGKDPVSKTFTAVAGTALTGGLSNVAKAKGLVNTAKAIKTAGKIKKAKSIS